ncbi:lipocalin family protein [Zunongwangia endophytica]|uniref:Lipocalin family protein n=1 Tax=Zunongwangia endophytica TaxID=1808945 RepID=A0ABV8H3W3_9FLAO|nr:lipocalin family protein [Zunongwangia endophytica]MDN3595936.1 lipocalin family protein [Zunongwangia endophytica]
MTNKINGTWKVSDIYCRGIMDLGTVNYEFVGQSIGFDNYTFNFSKGGTYKLSGSYTAAITTIIDGQQNESQEEIPFASASGFYAIERNTLFLETDDEIQEIDIVEISSDQLVLNASGSSFLTRGMGDLANVEVMDITLEKQ